MSDGNGRDLIDPRDDPFLTYGGGGAGIAGGAELLIYSANEGTYRAGMDKVPVALGTKVVVNVPGARTGWRKWVNNSIEQEDMALLVERPRLPPRSNYDADTLRPGERDPWQETNVFDVTTGDGSVYALPLSGVGGIRAAKKLILEYGQGRRSRPGQLPLVELGCAPYQSSYGKKYNPLLTIVGWVDEASLEPVEDVGGGDLPWAGGPEGPDAAPQAKPVEAAASKGASAKSAKAPRF